MIKQYHELTAVVVEVEGLRLDFSLISLTPAFLFSTCIFVFSVCICQVAKQLIRVQVNTATALTALLV